MRFAQIAFVLVLLSGALALTNSARTYKAVVGMDLASFDQRDVLVIRTTGDVPVPGTFHRIEAAAQVSFLLHGAQANDVTAPAGGLALIKGVALDTSGPDGAVITITLAKPELTRPDCFRLSQPSAHVVLFEVFAEAGLKKDASLITDPEKQLGLSNAAPAASASAAAAPAQPAATSQADSDKLGVPTIDLRQCDASAALSLAAKSGLLKVNSRASVSTEGKGELLVRPAGQSLASWMAKTPPGVLYLSGKPEQIAAFMRDADPAKVSSLPSFEEYWGQNQSARPAPTVISGRSAAMRSRIKDDPFGGLYYADYLPGGSMLSDVRVTLPAMNGMNLYEVLDYLSEISGISLIIDPYAFDEPTGNTRPPKENEPPQGGENAPGFRPASVFQPQFPSGGSVIGNFIDVPFDTALRLILETQELEFVVYDNGTAVSGGRYGKASASGGDTKEPYSKPIILVTSRERMEQEIAGTNTIDLYQMHYADPTQVTNLLGNFNLLPGENTGWYIYTGPGGGPGGGAGQGGGGGGGNGRGGGGNRGGAGGGGGGIGGNTSFVMVYRGSSRAPVESAVAQAVAQGKSVVRVLLRPEAAGQLVTLFAQ